MRGESVPEGDTNGVFEVLELRGLRSPSCPDPNRRRRDGDMFGDFTQGKGVHVKR